VTFIANVAHDVADSHWALVNVLLVLGVFGDARELLELVGHYEGTWRDVQLFLCCEFLAGQVVFGVTSFNGIVQLLRHSFGHEGRPGILPLFDVHSHGGPMCKLDKCGSAAIAGPFSASDW